MTEDGEGILFGVVMGVVATSLIWFVITLKLIRDCDITRFEDKPYCEVQTIAGKRFKRCLKAVEVPNDGE